MRPSPGVVTSDRIATMGRFPTTPPSERQRAAGFAHPTTLRVHIVVRLKAIPPLPEGEHNCWVLHNHRFTPNLAQSSDGIQALNP